MDIVLFLSELGGGGAERFAITLSSGLADKGHTVTLLTGPVIKDEFEITSPRVRRIVLYKKLTLINNAFKLHKYLKDNIPDVCVAIGIYANLVAGIANIRLRTQIVLCERNAPKEDRISRKSRLLRYFVYPRGDAFVFQTPDAQSFYSRRMQDRSVVIPNPIKQGLPSRIDTGIKKQIVAVGRLMPQKNYLMLLKAFSIVKEKYPDYTLHIYGKGDEEFMIRKKIDEMGLARCVFLEGYTLNVHEKIRNSDIFVLSSDFEGMPNSLMEAMAMGFPVVSTDCPCGGPRMLIENGKNGILVPTNNPELFAGAILKYIDDPQYKEKCAKNALDINTACGLDHIVSLWLNFLQSIIK